MGVCSVFMHKVDKYMHIIKHMAGSDTGKNCDPLTLSAGPCCETPGEYDNEHT